MAALLHAVASVRSDVRLGLRGGRHYGGSGCRSVGEVTDIVEKEKFTFDPSTRPDGPRSGQEQRSKASLTLRPELTASFVRACVEHGLFKKKAFQKLFYIGANFRKERPQKGRLRQFHQFGVEALGATDPLLDAETVLLALRFFEELGVIPAESPRPNEREIA